MRARILQMCNRRVCCSRRAKLVFAVLIGVPLLGVLVLFFVCLGNALDARKPSWLADLSDSGAGVGLDLLPDDAADREARLDRFRRALRFQTVSTAKDDEQRRFFSESLSASEEPEGTEDFENLVQFIVGAFPLIHTSDHIEWSRVGADRSSNYSLVYKVRGEDPALLPYLLMAHMDVVPVEEEFWDYDPFNATVDDGFVYARGTIDDKNNVFSILEALEYKLKLGRPIRRTFYVALGHDEEIGGNRGQQHVAEFLRGNWGVDELAFILDEGLFIIDSLIPGVSGPVAIIGVTEKGAATVDLSITGMDAGHSSNPARESTIDVLADAILRLRSNPQPRSFDPGAPEYVMLESLAAYASFFHKLVYSNLWLFSGIVASQFETKRTTNAAIRTTTAFTMIEGGIKVNVMPASATATVNHRVHYSQTVQQVVDHDRHAVGDDRVQVLLKNGSFPAHPVSPFGPDAPYYKLLAKSVLQIYPDVPVGPGTLIANTDTRWYLNFTRNIYRFSAIRMDLADTNRFHGHNERISVENYFNLNNFYYRLMDNAENVRPPFASSSRIDGEL